MAEPTVSIIVPLYNEGENIAGLIAHLEALDGLHEAILVDASDDAESLAVIGRLRERSGTDSNILLESAAGPERSRQMNLGAEMAAGDIFLFLHCDTRLPENGLLLVKQSVADGNQWGRFDVALASEGWVFRVIECMIRLRSRVRSLATGDQGIFISSKLFVQSGGFPRIPLMEDVALSKVLKKFSKPGLIRRPVVTSARRWRNRGVIRTILLMWKLRFLFWIGNDPYHLSEQYGNER